MPPKGTFRRRGSPEKVDTRPPGKYPEGRCANGRRFQPKGIGMTRSLLHLSLATAAALGLFMLPGSAAANEQSALLTAQGLDLLQDGNNTAALEKFEAAVAADADDEDARYYLAHSRILAGNPQGALDTLGNREFEYWDADYLRGIAYNGLGDRNRAAQAFARSIRRDDNPRSRFYAGMLYFQAGQRTQAQRLFADADGLEADLEPYRRFYLGVLAADGGEQGEAERWLRSIRSDYPDSGAADLAAEMLGETQERKRKRIRLALRLTEQYDTNPALVQSDLNLARIYHPDLTESTGALRTSLFGLFGIPFGKERQGFQGSIGTSVYAALHHFNPAAVDFNLVQPGAHLEMGYAAERWRLSVPLSFDMAFLGRDLTHYSTAFGAAPGLSYAVNPKLALRGAVRAEAQNYGTDNSRNGLDIGIPLDVIARVAERVRIGAGYAFNIYNTAEVSEWSFVGHRLHAGTMLRPVDDLGLFANLAYYLRSYDEPFQVPGVGPEDRTDHELGIGLGSRYHISQSLDLTLAWDATIQSSIELFTYTRHIVSLSLGYTY